MKPYEIISYKNLDDLRIVVNGNIKKGYVPIGGVTFADGYYIQAMYNDKLKYNV